MSSDFSYLRSIAMVLLETDNEKQARDQYIRFLDGYDGSAELASVVDAIAIRLGLFPYVDPDPAKLGESDALLMAYHSPAALRGQGFVFHSEQQKVYETIKSAAIPKVEECKLNR